MRAAVSHYRADDTINISSHATSGCFITASTDMTTFFSEALEETAWSPNESVLDR